MGAVTVRIFLEPERRTRWARGCPDGKQMLFHPYHVVPRAEFAAAFLKPAHQPEAQVGVELHAVVVLMGVGMVRAGDAGAEIANALGPENVLQSGVEPFAQAHAPGVLGDVHAGLRRPVVGPAFLEPAHVGVAQNFVPLLGHQIGIEFQGVGDAPGELLHRGHVVFEGNGGVPHVGGVDGQQRLRVLRPGHAQCDFFGRHGRFLLLRPIVALTCEEMPDFDKIRIANFGRWG